MTIDMTLKGFRSREEGENWHDYTEEKSTIIEIQTIVIVKNQYYPIQLNFSEKQGMYELKLTVKAVSKKCKLSFYFSPTIPYL